MRRGDKGATLISRESSMKLFLDDRQAIINVHPCSIGRVSNHGVLNINFLPLDYLPLSELTTLPALPRTRNRVDYFGKSIC